jgi:hypothetical protein
VPTASFIHAALWLLPKDKYIRPTLFRILIIYDYQFSYQEFDLLQLILNNQNETMWLARWRDFLTFLLVYITLSHCTVFLWREMDCFCALWNETVLKLCDILYFMLPKSVHILLEINFNAFYAFWGCFIFFFTFHKLLEPNAFHIGNEILRFIMVVGVAVNHKCQNCIVYKCCVFIKPSLTLTCVCEFWKSTCSHVMEILELIDHNKYYSSLQSVICISIFLSTILNQVVITTVNCSTVLDQCWRTTAM